MKAFKVVKACIQVSHSIFCVCRVGTDDHKQTFTWSSEEFSVPPASPSKLAQASCGGLCVHLEIAMTTLDSLSLVRRALQRSSAKARHILIAVFVS